MQNTLSVIETIRTIGLLSFAIYDKSESTVYFSDEVLKNLKLCDGYDLISDEVMGEIRNIEYAKKYGDLVNEYQSVKIMVENNALQYTLS